MKSITEEVSQNPTFNSIVGLSNTTYDNTNIRSGQMSTEDQIRQVNQKADALQTRINTCCRNLCMWKTYLRIVEEKTGIVVSDFFDNVETGFARRGVPFTVEFSRVLDFDKFSDEKGGSDRIGNNNKWGSTINCNSFNDDGTLIENVIVKMLNDVYEDSTSVRVSDQVWPQILTEITPGQVSRISQSWNSSGAEQYKLKNLPRTANVRDNLYRVYKDDVDGKLKIDVLGKNQFGNSANTIYGFYKTVFITQWVLRDGATL